ncbi:sialate O-acetylesterase [Hoylesella oralis]|uniref:sialate O-acetylesterase n=1 Tax=Hoylesella oralis TaxID=28134 RepID=UPI00361C3DD6
MERKYLKRVFAMWIVVVIGAILSDVQAQILSEKEMETAEIVRELNFWDPIKDIDKDNFYIYIVFGQSNAEGYAAYPTATDKVPNPDILNLISYNDYENEDKTGYDHSRVGQWEPVSEPNCRKSNRFKTACSMVKSFGETMLAKNPRKKFGFVHVAVASASIRLFDKDKYDAYLNKSLGAPLPNDGVIKKSVYAYGGNPYQRIIEMAKIAQQYGTIKGILMHQGEEDEWYSYWASEVKKVYKDMLRDLHLKSTEVPLIIGEPTGAHSISHCFDDVVDENNPKYIPNCYKIKCRDLPYNPNNKLHFTRDGYIEMGKRFADKASELLNQSTGISQTIMQTPWSVTPVAVQTEFESGGIVHIQATLPLVKIQVSDLNGNILQKIALKNESRFTFCLSGYSRRYVILSFFAVNGTQCHMKALVL